MLDRQKVWTPYTPKYTGASRPDYVYAYTTLKVVDYRSCGWPCCYYTDILSAGGLERPAILTETLTNLIALDSRPRRRSPVITLRVILLVLALRRALYYSKW